MGMRELKSYYADSAVVFTKIVSWVSLVLYPEMQITAVWADLAKFRQLVTMLTMFSTRLMDLAKLVILAIFREISPDPSNHHACYVYHLNDGFDEIGDFSEISSNLWNHHTWCV